MPVLAQTLHQVDAVAEQALLPSANVAEFITHTFGFFRSEHLAAQRRCLKKRVGISWGRLSISSPVTFCDKRHIYQVFCHKIRRSCNDGTNVNPSLHAVA